jgi:adenosylhomocysteine nucleosidase
MRLACDLPPRKHEVRGTIAVTFALAAESSKFLRRLSNKSHADRNGLRIIRGSIADRVVEVLHTGVGEKICRGRIGKLLQDRQIDLLISTGFAGALRGEFRVGDLVVAKNFSTFDLNKRLLSARLPAHEVEMFTVSAMIDSSKERERTARESGASAVDMETEFIAQACAKHAVPLLALRVITDTPNQSFPAPPNILFDIERQRARTTRLTKFFLAHPHRVPALIQFARRIARARKILADALVTLFPNL